jgi:meso-butanediol dehydrogenase / (S,S)-butanediol dehydrogenase / diacetyl reductase
MDSTARLGSSTALVTGAGSGIGAAIVERFVGEGAQVIAADLDAAAAAATAEQIGANVLAAQVDVRDEASVAALIATAHATAPLDVLVNVAGIGSTTNAIETPVEVWDAVLDVNARGTFLCCKHALPQMVERKSGAIINIGSVAGLVGLRNRAAYCAAKGAVIAFTRALAVDHAADGVRVNCICPGTIDSPWVRRLVEQSGESLDDLRARQPIGRLGTPAEVAELALYLAAASSGFMTGSVLTIDGGLTAG